MPPPRIRIPISANMAEFEQNMSQLRSVSGRVATQVADNFIQMNRVVIRNFDTIKKVGIATFDELQTGSRRAALAAGAAWAAAIVVAIEALVAIVSAARRQMQEVIDLADRASRAGVSPGWFQAFISASREMRVEIKTLEQALENAFQTMKDKLDPNWKSFQEGTRRINELEKALIDVRELFTTFQTFTGLELARTATNQEERVIALLTAMKELKAIGQDLAAIDLAERFFSPALADALRRGETSVEKILDALMNAPKFASELVTQTKEVDRALQEASDRLSRAMAPAWSSVIERINFFKGILTDVITLLARGAEILNNWTPGGGTRLERVARAANIPLTEQQRLNQAFQDVSDTFVPFSRQEAGRVPFPRARPPTDPEEETKKHLDAVEHLINAMQRSNEMLEVELRTLGLATVEREKGLAIARAEAAARSAQRELTAKEREEIEALATAHARLADQLKLIRDIQSEIRELGSAFADAFKSAVIEGQKLDVVINRLLQRLASRAIDTAFNVAFNAIANAIVPGLVGPGGGVLPGGRSLGLGGIGSAQHGGPVSAGRPYVVGERGPELMVPRTSGFVVPNNQLGGMTFSPTTMIDARGSQMTEHQMAAIVAQGNARLYQQIKKDLPAWQSRYSKLGRT